MIKSAGTLTDGRPFLALGLSDENWVRLRAGKPIVLNLRDIHANLPDMKLVVLGGDTEASLTDDLRAVGMA